MNLTLDQKLRWGGGRARLLQRRPRVEELGSKTRH